MGGFDLPTKVDGNVGSLSFAANSPSNNMVVNTMDAYDPEREKRIEMERRAAQAILDDLQADQLSRDLAHLRLQHKEGVRDDGDIAYGKMTENLEYAEVPEEWLALEAYEAGMVWYSDWDIVSMVEDPLLRNKCKTVRSVFLPSGKVSIEGAYPRLSQALENILGSVSRDPTQTATAHAVKACLIRPVDKEQSIAHFKQAIRVRPCDWRLPNAMASSYMSLGNTSMSFEALSQAAKLTEEDSFDRFEVESSRGKVLFNLARMDEAEKVLLSVLNNVEKFRDRISPLEFGHLVVTEYQLCLIYVMNNQKTEVDKFWKSAEAKYNSLSPHVRGRIEWESRHIVQTMIGMQFPNMLNQRECHHCRILCSDPKTCSACKVARYCSKECQKAAWKAGHKQECQPAKDLRKETKKEQKIETAKVEALRKLPPLDVKLDPYELWAKGKKCDDPIDAVFYFVMALFLDFSLDAQDFSPVIAAIKKCPSADHPLILSLDSLPQISKLLGPDYLERADKNRLRALQSVAHLPTNSQVLCENYMEIDRKTFGIAMCHIFQARLMNRAYSCQSPADAMNPINKQAFDDIVKLINNGAQLFMDTDRWLTIQFELGYSNFDVGATEEAQRWLNKFIENLNKLEKSNGNKLSKHWKKWRQTAKQKIAIIPLMRISNAGLVH